MTMRISFPGGVAVNAEFGAHVIRTDQPPKQGGSGSAPPPFDLFLASIGTCAGFYALRFCQERNIDTRELGVSLDAIRETDGHQIGRIIIKIELPPGFPDKYRGAIVRAIDHCAVKRQILQPPRFEVELKAPVAA